MPLDNTDVLPRRVMTLFLLVDSSGSMTVNGRIAQVNAAIEEMQPLLREVSDENADAEIRIAVLEFSTGCKWVTNGAESLDTFFWNDLTASGVTEMGAAFLELESKLSRMQFLASSTGSFAPAIILLSDGAPTDNWEAGLAALRKNNWFKNAMKIAVAVADADMSVMSAFTGSPETVVLVKDDRETLKKLLNRLVVIASTIQSRSKTSGQGDNDESIATQNAIDAVQGTVVNDTSGSIAVPGSTVSAPSDPSAKNPWGVW